MSEYVSTRGNPEIVGFEHAAMEGYAPDGGLYVPARGLPHVSLQKLEELQGQPYEEVFNYINGLFVGDAIPDEAQRKLTAEAYGPDNFPHAKDGNVVPVDRIDENIARLNLSLGPMAAFKDMALQPLGGQMNYLLTESGKHLIVVTATSGDTGGSAAKALKGLSGIDLFVLSPEEGMSPFQKAQMGGLSGGNIHNLSVNGDFDKCLELVTEANGQFNLGAVNSINWGRIAAQIPYYFSGYLQTAEEVGEPIDISVPTGNVGNMLSAYYAREMGLPIRRIIAANNENDTTSRFINTGIYEPRKRETTSSPSMDITRPKNLERLIYDVLGGDEEKVRQFMAAAQTGAVALSDYCDLRDLTELGFGGSSSTHEDRVTTIRQVHEATDGKVIIDPHTADGVFAAKENDSGDGVTTLVPATALPVKFEEIVREAIGHVPEREERFKGIERKVAANAFTAISDVDELLSYIEANSRIGLRV